MTRTLLPVSLILLLVGCGGGLERIPLSGKVTFNGQPIEEGQIRFVPDASTQKPITVEPIIKGEYDTSTSGGLPVGTYQIQFLAFDTRFPKPSGPGAPDRPQLLPPRCNTRSEYEITFESGQGAVKKDFELK